MKNACTHTATFATGTVFCELNKTKTGMKEIVGCIGKRYVANNRRCGSFNVKLPQRNVTRGGFVPVASFGFLSAASQD